jgi:acylglycerol lipase
VNSLAQTNKLNVDDGVELFMLRNLLKSPKVAVILVHGLCEHSGRYEYVVSRLNDFGYSVYRFDNRGHGRSSGERGYIADYQIFVDDAQKIVGIAGEENPGIPLFMLGHSMGGFITASYGVKYPGKLAGQILSGAAVTVQPIFKDMASFDYNATPLAPIPNMLADIICHDPRVVRAYKQDPLVIKEFTTKLRGEISIRGAKHLMNSMNTYKYPCLILHGGGDQIVTSDSSKYFYDHISSTDKQLKIYEGLYHEILNEPEKDIIIEDIRLWIEARIR